MNRSEIVAIENNIQGTIEKNLPATNSSDSDMNDPSRVLRSSTSRQHGQHTIDKCSGTAHHAHDRSRVCAARHSSQDLRTLVRN